MARARCRDCDWRLPVDSEPGREANLDYASVIEGRPE